MTGPPPLDERSPGEPGRWHQRHRRLLALAGAVVAAGVTGLWVVVVPDKADAVGGVQAWVVRYGHPASWACLTGLALAVAADAPRLPRDLLAWSALVSYAAFLLALAL